jgi:hypothetical protein
MRKGADPGDFSEITLQGLAFVQIALGHIHAVLTATERTDVATLVRTAKFVNKSANNRSAGSDSDSGSGSDSDSGSGTGSDSARSSSPDDATERAPLLVPAAVHRRTGTA